MNEKQLKIALDINDRYAAQIRELYEELRDANETIGSHNYRLREALAQIEKADGALRRAQAEIAMLQARIESGHGADKKALMTLYVRVSDAERMGRLKVTKGQMDALAEVAL
jgi:predicted  nucleic acid-binding Zn-ribbon protein